MKLLALDTSSRYGSVALLEDETLVAERLTLETIQQCERLTPTIEALLGEVGWTVGSLDAFVVVRGPGTFSGVRIGLATVLGLVAATGRPAVGICSLEAIARGMPWCMHPICPVLDARKGEIYTALYRWDEQRLLTRLEPTVLSADRLAETLAPGPLVLAGDGAPVLEKALEARPDVLPLRPPLPCAVVRAAVAGAYGRNLLLAHPQGLLETLLPLYLRPSEAEIKAGLGGATGDGSGRTA